MRTDHKTYRILSVFEIKRPGTPNFPEDIKFCFMHPSVKIDGVAILETGRRDRPDSRFKHLGPQIAYGFCENCYKAVQAEPQKQALKVEDKMDKLFNQGVN